MNAKRENVQSGQLKWLLFFKKKLPRVHWEMCYEEMGRKKIQRETWIVAIHAASHGIEEE